MIAVALAIGLFAVADGIRDRGAGDTISVTGSAKRSISSDYLIWNASISVQRETTGAAAAQLERWLERTLAALRASGIQDDELTVAAISTASVRGRAGKLTGFRLTRAFQVRSVRLDAVLASSIAARTASRLLAAGVPLSAGQPQYVYTKLAELRPALSADATKDALRRAEAIVEITGDELGGVRNVYSSPFQVTAPGSTEVEDYGIYDTSTREKEVTAVVNVTFAVK